MNQPILNIADVELRDWGHGAPPMYPGATAPKEDFQARLGDIAGKIGAQKLGYGLVVVPPGKRAWPAHSHRVNEEAFFILDGQGEVRIGQEVFPIKKGDFIATPPGGPETAHQIRNTSAKDELKYIAISTRETPEIVHYPRLWQSRCRASRRRPGRQAAALVASVAPGTDPHLLGWRVVLLARRA